MVNPRGGDTKANFLRSVIVPIFQNNQINGYLYDTTFIIGMCHRSSAYERDWKYPSYHFVNIHLS